MRPITACNLGKIMLRKYNLSQAWPNRQCYIAVGNLPIGRRPNQNMNAWQTWMVMIAAVFSVCFTSSCVSESSRVEHVEHYVSPKVEGEAQKINLEEVQKAFFESQGKDFN